LRVCWTAYLVKLAGDLNAAASVYRYVLNRAGVGAPFEMAGNSSPGVMIYPRVLQDAILYVITSETAKDVNLDLRDKLGGGRRRCAFQHNTRP